MHRRRLNTAYNVSTNRCLLERYAYLEERLFGTLAGWIWTTPRLEHKIEFGQMGYEDALHADALRRRAAELAPATEAPLQPPDLMRLEQFCNEVTNAATFVERLVGAFRVVKPALLRAYRQHLAATDDLLDGPTVVVLKQLVVAETDHIAWGEEALQAALDEPGLAQQLARTWQRHLEAAWRATGGVEDDALEGALPTYRHAGPPARETSFPARDGRHRLVSVDDYAVASMGETPNEVVRHLLYQNAYGEMEAEDLLGQLLAHTPELPWRMRLDLARQMWDEARHAEMSWRRMEELGGPPDPLPPVPPLILAVVGEAVDPLEQLIVLQRAIEGRVTERHRYRVVHLAQDLHDPQTARLFEYIVADERSHIGNSAWIDRLVGDDPERIARLQAVEARAERVLEDMLNRRVDSTVRPG
jgi:bacterioferritin (cytochrome b1)